MIKDNRQGLLIPSQNHSHFTIIDGAINEVVSTRDGLRTKYLQHLPEELTSPDQFLPFNIDRLSPQNVKVINDCIIDEQSRQRRRNTRHAEISDVVWSGPAFVVYLVLLAWLLLYFWEGALV